jgi:hypothetical protein
MMKIAIIIIFCHEYDCRLWIPPCYFYHCSYNNSLEGLNTVLAKLDIHLKKLIKKDLMEQQRLWEAHTHTHTHAHTRTHARTHTHTQMDFVL